MILVAPTAFKGTLSSRAVADAVALGIQRARPDTEFRLLPVSDGGNGLIDSLRGSVEAELLSRRVSDPLGRTVDARVLLLEERDGRTAVIESADACGLHLLTSDERDPLRVHSRGVGELLIAAMRAGCDRIVMGLGGSATVDGGIGMARALGWSFRDSHDAPIADGGAGLSKLHTIEPPTEAPVLPPVVALCDVLNPLTGADGAARVFAPQKGASPDEVRSLDAGLERLAMVLQRDLGQDVAPLAGAGAAGGLGAGCHAFLGSTLVSGSDWILDRLHFDGALRSAELVVTGEGEYDAQSAMGKVTGRIVDAAARAGVPVLLVAGRISVELPAHVTGVVGDDLDSDRIAELIAGVLKGGDRDHIQKL